MAEFKRLKGFWWLPWTRRSDKQLQLIGPREFFGGIVTQKGQEKGAEIFSIPIRVIVLVYLAILIGFFLYTLLVLIANQSALEHKCEKLFTLWTLACTNCTLYGVMVLAYICCLNPSWFRGAVITVIMVLAAVVAWWLFVWGNMAPICVTFYHLQYPYLLHLLHICGTLDAIMLLSLVLYECCFTCFKAPSAEDPIISTSVFWKDDETWVPPLFEAPEVTTYKEGVQKWTQGAQKRVGQLRASLNKADEIRKNSENQSLLLRQVTELVVETEAKVTKVESLMDEQEQLVGDFQDSFARTKEMMDHLNEKDHAGLEMCTRGDACLWLFLVFLCCASYICLQLAFSKWAGLFGFSADPLME